MSIKNHLVSAIIAFTFVGGIARVSGFLDISTALTPNTPSGLLEKDNASQNCTDMSGAAPNACIARFNFFNAKNECAANKLECNTSLVMVYQYTGGDINAAGIDQKAYDQLRKEANVIMAKNKFDLAKTYKANKDRKNFNETIFLAEIYTDLAGGLEQVNISPQEWKSIAGKDYINQLKASPNRNDNTQGSIQWHCIPA